MNALVGPQVLGTTQALIADDAFIHRPLFKINNLYLKLESLNPAGSIKMKTAIGLIANLEAEGKLTPESVLIESSSGNLGVALSMICAERGLRFICVTDPNCSRHNLRIMKAYGASIVVIDRLDANGGFLGARIAYIRDQLRVFPNFVWLNQYENPGNRNIHARMTARSIAAAFPKIDYLFVGAGTAGTLMGCHQYFSRQRPCTKIVAVDSVGSVTFGAPAGKRHIPGLGASQPPPAFSPEGIHAMQLVPESASVLMCRHMARQHGLLLGGSSGTVLAALWSWRERFVESDIIVAISPDSGERYMDTIYDDDWALARFGEPPLRGDLGALSELGAFECVHPNSKENV